MKRCFSSLLALIFALDAQHCFSVDTACDASKALSVTPRGNSLSFMQTWSLANGTVNYSSTEATASTENASRLLVDRGQRQPALVVRDQQPTDPELAARVESKMREKKAMAARGDLHFTVHNCYCRQTWEYDGTTYEACTGPADVDFAEGFPWCIVNDECAGPDGILPSGQKWDHCSHPDTVVHETTVHGCHCNPWWEWEGEEMHGCVKTVSGASWCNVFEGDALCPEALKTEHFGPHWDHCFPMEDTPPFLSQNGCHCKPKWTLGDVVHEGCAEVLVDGKNATGCVVHEDTYACPEAKKMIGDSLNQRFDLCTLVTGKEVYGLKDLDVAGDPSCHCQPKWIFEDKVYRGCEKGAGSDRALCPLIEDERLCPEAHGFMDRGLQRQRWRYCEPEAATEEEEEEEENEAERPEVKADETPKVERPEVRADETPKVTEVRVTPIVIPIDDMLKGRGTGQISGEIAEGDKAHGEHGDAASLKPGHRLVALLFALLVAALGI